MMARSVAGVIGIVLTTGCSFMGMDSFEPYEVAQGEYLMLLPAEHRDSFPSDYHAIAYALATDCFVDMEPATERDVAVQTACRDIPDEAVLSRLMTLDDFCDDVRSNRDAGADIEEGQFCDG